MLHATDSDSVSNSSQNSVDEIYVKSILTNLEVLKESFFFASLEALHLAT